MAEIPFRREMRFEYGVAEPVTPLIRRIVARNPGPFTYTGTGTYIVGRGQVAVIDPGPALAEHVESLLEALDGETVTHILVTHTHLDHSPAASVLRQRTGAPTLGFGPHGGDRDGGSVEAGADRDFVPEIILRDGDAVDGADWRLEAVHTPGHTSNHLCFALPQEAALFTGDHVMGWSTSVIAPPDGNMAAYMLALERLLTRPDAIYWPTHGGPIRDPTPHVHALITHRRARRAAILDAVGRGHATVETIVAKVYADLDPRLVAAAGRSVLAHLIELAEAGVIASDGPPSLTGRNWYKKVIC